MMGTHLISFTILSLARVTSASCGLLGCWGGNNNMCMNVQTKQACGVWWNPLSYRDRFSDKCECTACSVPCGHNKVCAYKSGVKAGTICHIRHRFNKSYGCGCLVADARKEKCLQNEAHKFVGGCCLVTNPQNPSIFTSLPWEKTVCEVVSTVFKLVDGGVKVIHEKVHEAKTHLMNEINNNKEDADADTKEMAQISLNAIEEEEEEEAADPKSDEKKEGDEGRM